MDEEKYKNLLKKAIEKDYRKADESNVIEVDFEHANIASKLDIDDRMEITAKKQSFISIKDHKEDFPNVIKTRLIIWWFTFAQPYLFLQKCSMYFRWKM